MLSYVLPTTGFGRHLRRPTVVMLEWAFSQQEWWQRGYRASSKRRCCSSSSSTCCGPSIRCGHPRRSTRRASRAPAWASSARAAGRAGPPRRPAPSRRTRATTRPSGATCSCSSRPPPGTSFRIIIKVRASVHIGTNFISTI